MKKLSAAPLLFVAFALIVSACAGGKKSSKVKDPGYSIYLDSIFVTPGNTEYKASPPLNSRVVHTSLYVDFDWEKRHVNGKARLTLVPHFYPQDSVVLDAKGFDIHKVAMVKDTLNPLDFSYDSLQLTVRLGRTFSRKDTFHLYIRYTAKPDETPKGNTSAISDRKGLYFINPDGSDSTKPKQIWTQGEPESNSRWFPTIDKPNQRSSQEIFVTVDTGFVTLSNGKLLGQVTHPNGTRTDHWRQDLPHAPYLFALIVGRFDITRDWWKNIPVDYYLEPKYAPFARQIFGLTPEMLTFFSEKLKTPYPWDKYAQVVVRDFVSGAMENTGAVVFYEGLHQTPREMLDDHHEDIIAHELFHHWFGDLVTCESWSNIPLNEAFATYGEYLWFEHKYGRDYADHHLKLDLDAYLREASGTPKKLIRFHYEDPDELFDSHSYQKGGRILHQLRYTIGDEAFFEALHLYLQRHSYQSVEFHQLRLIFEEVTGQDLNWFFDQWFLHPGHPKLLITYDYDTAGQMAKVFVSQDNPSADDRTFRLPLFVDVYTEAGVERYHRILEKDFETFEFASATPPRFINLDGDKMLLGEKTDLKLPEMWAWQFRLAPLYLDRLEAINGLAGETPELPLTREILFEALRDPFWHIRKTAFKHLAAISQDGDSVLRKEAVRLAGEDPKSSVRADALEFLALQKDTALLPFFQKAIQTDSSWSVAAAGLEAIADLDSTLAIRLAQEFETEENLNIVLAVGAIYEDFSEPGKTAWFLNQLSKQREYAGYYLFENLGNYLSNFIHSEAKDALPAFEKALMDEDLYWWVRFSAFQGLRAANAGYLAKIEKLEAATRQTLPVPGKDVFEKLDIARPIQREMEQLMKKAKELPGSDTFHRAIQNLN